MKKVKNPLRQLVPTRTCTKTYSKYGKFKEALRSDFKTQCGYCADSDVLTGKRNYHIDHFVPKDQLRTIQENDYSNLVYSCFYCNNSKSSDWPTNNESVAVTANNEGYIDPCNPNYDQQYYRDYEGTIVPQTELGKYMHDKLKLYLKRHSVLWMLEILSSQIKVLETLKKQKGLSAKNKEKLVNLLEKQNEYIEYLKDENSK
jgi:uncharacterized protein (TIGR02646 family)